ncbi:protein phosphatase 2C domain-containing protein [Pyxidicoccus caerfyrddinensis]|uniref:protein phosphatase 2C domain-containing protein n=1 Tax=Pyxidicoccus caerfyrddinensis TaxID=2709663 RepID=UPI0013DB47A7|nr:protein phosphatase 2C domain-containing protein [Pyxidicoccus caerfyrddinensis]
MRIRLEAVSLQKAGNQPSENEDAYAPESAGASRGAGASGVAPFLAAVADGATESLFSGHWARLLAGAFARGEVPDAQGLLAVLPELQRQWHAHVGAKPLPWYAEEKLREGAFATLLGVRLSEQPTVDCSGTWEALAVGDSCLFQLRRGGLLRSFPWSSPPRSAPPRSSSPRMCTRTDAWAHR